MTYTFQGKSIVLSKNEAQTSWGFKDFKPLLLGNGKHLYYQDLEITTLLSAYVGDGTPLPPGEEVVYNFEETGTLLIKSKTILGRTLFKNKYNMTELTNKTGVVKKFKPEFFKNNPTYWGRELYENRTILEEPEFSTYRGFPGCLDGEALKFETICNTTYPFKT